jgi:hypothetical protein
MIYPEHLLTALGFFAGFVVLALVWIWLVLTLARAIAQLWRDLAGRGSVRSSAARRRPSVPVRPTARSPARERRPSNPNPRPSHRSGLLSRLTGWLRPPSNTPKRLRGPPRRAINRWNTRPNAAPSSLDNSKQNESKPQATVPLFVIDAPLFQSDPDVFEARPANILEVLEDACSAARAAGRTDDEITQMLTQDVRRTSSGPRPPPMKKDDPQ